MAAATASELREERAGLIEENRKLVDRAEADKRNLTAEENAEWDKRWSAIEDLKTRVDRIERQEAEERAQLLSERETRDKPPREKEDKNPETTTTERTDDEERDDPYADYECADEFRHDPEYRSAFRASLSGKASVDQKRSLSVGLDTEGGYLVPQTFIRNLIKAVDNLVFIRQRATVYPVRDGANLGMVSLDADPADPTWTSEVATGSEDSTMAFGGRELTPHPLAQLLKVTRKLLRALPNVERIVRERLAYKFAVVEESNFMTGSGSNCPLGLFTASASGINTDRDVSTGNSTTAIGADNLIECKYTLKGQYQDSSEWVFHRDAVKQLAKLKDGDGRYLWAGSLVANDPDRLLGLPVNMSEYAPNTFTTGLYVGLLGDLRHYVIADALSMTVQRLDELYAETNQVGFIGRLECDGMPVLSEAFVRSKLA